MLLKENSTLARHLDNRVSIYDWVRLFATILVVIGHSTYLTIGSVYGSVNYILPEKISPTYYSGILLQSQNIASWIYGFHMPLFFILSGAVLGLKPIACIDQFVVSKIRRLLVPFFIYSWLFVIPVKLWSGFYTRDNVYSAMRGMLSGEEGSHLWFLTSLFWCMICFVIIEKIVKRYTNSVYVLLLISCYIQFIYDRFPFDFIGLKSGLSYIFWFALGYVFERERKEHGLWKTSISLFACFVMALIEFGTYKNGILDSFFSALCGSFFVFLVSDICSRVFPKITNTRIWKLIIRNLFYVYIFHDPLEYVVLKMAFTGEWLVSSFGCYLYLFCRTIVVFVCSILLGEIITFICKLLGEHHNTKSESTSDVE